MRQMAVEWARLEGELQSSMDALALQIQALRDSGEVIGPGKLYRMERYSRLLFEIRQETAKYADYAARTVTTGQQEAVWLGQQEAQHTLEVAAREAQGLAAQADAAIAGGRAKIARGDDLFNWATTDRQRKAAERLYREGEAQVKAAMAAGKPAAQAFAAPAFTRLAPSAVEGMVGMMGDGTPLRQHLQGVYGDAARGMSKYLVRAVTQGLNPRETARQMRKGLGIGLDRALTIARTEQLRVYRESQRLTYQASGVVEGYQRISAKSRRTCLGCLLADGQVYPLSVPFEDHVAGRCLSPGTVVSGAPVVAFIARHYQGDLLTIRTASGKLLSVTPNHPILTLRGWIAAKVLHEGDEVVSEGGLDGTAAGVRPGEYQVPTRVEDVPRTLGMDRLVTVPTAAEDFHGDGTDGEVYVVWANRLLRDRRQAALAQPTRHKFLGLRNVGRALLAGGSNLAAMSQRQLDAARCFLGNPYAAQMLLLGGSGGEQAVGGRLVTGDHSGLYQARADGPARNAGILRQSIFGLPGEVAFGKRRRVEPKFGASGPPRLRAAQGVPGGLIAEQTTSLKRTIESLVAGVPASNDRLRTFAGNVVLDRILEIGCRTFAGHVYNLQTETGWYSASGIITHNCAAIPILTGADAHKWERGQAWLEKQPEGVQREVMGPGRYNLWQSGEVPLEQMKQYTHDPVWGGSWGPTPVKDLVGTSGNAVQDVVA